MTSKYQAERSDAMAMQREKERERRRLRDRERRQNMTQEQRERHLARRRRNYQLRRLRAQNNAKTIMIHPSQTNANTKSSNAIQDNLLNNVNVHYVGSPALKLPSISDIQEGAHNLRKWPRRLSLTNVRHLARRLQCDDNNQQQNEEDVPMKRMSLIHVKRLARALKVSVS